MKNSLLLLLATISLFGISACQTNKEPLENAYTDVYEEYTGRYSRIFQIHSEINDTFVNGITVYSNRITAEEEMCLTIRIGEVGDIVGESNEIFRHFTSRDTYSFTLNNTTVNRNESYYVSQEAQLLSEDGTPIPGNLDYCFSTSTLSEGEYSASITLIDMMNRSYSFAWLFQITSL